MSRFLLYILIFFVFFISACSSEKKPEPVVIVKTPEQVDAKTPSIIRSLLNEGKLYKGRIDDSLTLKQPEAVDSIYQGKDFNTFWSGKGQWHPSSDSLIDFITHAKLYGLFPEDYHLRYLNSIRSRMKSDTFITKDHLDAALWARADLLFTDALIQLTWDLKMGRLPADSITLRKDSVLTNEFYKLQFDKVLGSSSLTSILDSLEPHHTAYRQLKAAIKNFLDSGDFKKYTFINFPTKDTAALKISVQQRLFEGGYIPFNNRPVDSLQLSNGIKNYQIDKGLKADGKIGAETIRMLNDFDNERFIRLAITLDKYKHLTQQLPQKYLWVNIPGFDLKLMESDTVKLYSKIVVGKPYTPTPVLTSALTDMITYPQWTVPQSIITKEILPATKKDPGYISKKGFSLVNDQGEEVDPYFVDWSLYKKIIPFKIVQGSGDDNALGIFKFNFNNKYAVYLHDTNQRHFFGKSERALSHGCVRVQEWQKLTYYILRNDSLNSRYSNYTSMDSIKRWLREKEKHVIPVRNKIPIFIRYFTCESKNDKLVFYNDIYGEDKRLRDRYFRDK